MRDHELYAAILGLTAPWTVHRVEVDVPGGAVHVWVTRAWVVRHSLWDTLALPLRALLFLLLGLAALAPLYLLNLAFGGRNAFWRGSQRHRDKHPLRLHDRRQRHGRWQPNHRQRYQTVVDAITPYVLVIIRQQLARRDLKRGGQGDRRVGRPRATADVPHRHDRA